MSTSHALVELLDDITLDYKTCTICVFIDPRKLLILLTINCCVIVILRQLYPYIDSHTHSCQVTRWSLTCNTRSLLSAPPPVVECFDNSLHSAHPTSDY